MRLITDIEKFLETVKDGEKISEVIRQTRKNPLQGKHIINGDCYVNVMSYVPNKNQFDGLFECHKHYIDVQYLITGSEKLYYGLKNEMEIVREYNEEKDIEFLSGKNFESLEYKQGQAVLLETGEAHAPGYFSDTDAPMMKAIIKIRVL